MNTPETQAWIDALAAHRTTPTRALLCYETRQQLQSGATLVFVTAALRKRKGSQRDEAALLSAILAAGDCGGLDNF